MDAVELSIHRQNTKAFIDSDPAVLAIVRPGEVRTDAGGRKKSYDAEPLAPQTFRLIPVSDSPEEIKTSTGRLTAPKYTIMASWDADIQQWDHFDFQGVTYEVATPIRPSHTSNPYWLKADVVVHRNA